MAQDARARRRAQRATAKAVREHRSQLPKGWKRQSRYAIADAIIRGDRDPPAKGSPEGNMLASIASLAKYGKAPEEYLEAFKEYFYKERNKQL